MMREWHETWRCCVRLKQPWASTLSSVVHETRFTFSAVVITFVSSFAD